VFVCVLCSSYNPRADCITTATRAISSSGPFMHAQCHMQHISAATAAAAYHILVAVAALHTAQCLKNRNRSSSVSTNCELASASRYTSAHICSCEQCCETDIQSMCAQSQCAHVLMN
jgi:hypothetical protein